jgi:hypothetical protein
MNRLSLPAVLDCAPLIVVCGDKKTEAAAPSAKTARSKTGAWRL